MRENPKSVGERSEGMVLAALLRSGRVVLQPFGDNQRYDLVIDEGGGRFVRLQCKTAQLTKGVLRFNTCSSQTHKATGKRDYRGDIEAFAVYSPVLDKVYIVPVGEVGTGTGFLRLQAPKNNQTKGIRLAAQYELGAAR